MSFLEGWGKTSSHGNLPRILDLGKAVVSWMFSFEVFFAIFLFIGVFKESPRLSWVPFDLTLFGFLASLLAAFWLFIKNGFVIPRFRVMPFLGFIIFCAWAVLSLLWSPSSDYGVSKAAYLVVFGLWSYLGGLILIGSDRIRIRRFCVVVVLLSFWILIEITILIFSGEILRELDWGNQYLSQGRLMGLGVLCLLGLYLCCDPGTKAKFGLTILTVVLMVGLLVLGGRGPLLATIVAMGVVFYRGIRLNKEGLFIGKNLVIILSALIGVGLWFYYSGNMYFNTTTIDRFQMIFGSGGEGSVNMRFWLYDQSWENWLTKPLFGHGLGSFGILLGWGDVQIYPHNIFLEILVELGLVGLVMFSNFLYSSTRMLKSSFIRSDPYAAFVTMVLINTFLNALVSSDLSGNRVLYAALGLVAGYTRGSRQTGIEVLQRGVGTK